MDPPKFGGIQRLPSTGPPIRRPPPVRWPDDLLGRRKPSVSHVTLRYMEVTESLVAAIPPGNLRVPRTDFGAVWAVAERRNRENAERSGGDWYAAGVVVTCRWLAGAVVQTPMGRRHPASSPVSDRAARAYEELIEAEFLAAERLDLLRPDLVEHRPGWCEAIRATLRWAWRCDGPPPIAVPTAHLAGCQIGATPAHGASARS